MPKVMCVNASVRRYADGVYSVLAGKEVARALAVMSLKADDCTADLAGVTPKHLDTLRGWIARFERKYPVVGKARAWSVTSIQDKGARASAVRDDTLQLTGRHTQAPFEQGLTSQAKKLGPE